MSIARKEMNFNHGLDQKRTIESLQHIYDQLQMIDHVLDLQIDQAVLDNFHQHNQQVNMVMRAKSNLLQLHRKK